MPHETRDDPTPKQLTIVSGKGGTGKTTVTASFAALAPNKVLADCDVDAANLHLLLRPRIQATKQFYGAKVALRDESRCQRSGECERHCRFDAITPTSISETRCEGCGVCVQVCPAGALRLEPALTGDYYLSETPYGPLAHARLASAAESSGGLVTMVRNQAEDLAQEQGYRLIIVDGPPGIGCTVVAAITGVDLVLIVSEPTLSAMHDMERVHELANHFGIPTALFLNKADLNPDNARQLRRYCKEQGIHLVGELPFDERVPQSLVQGVPLVEYTDGLLREQLVAAWGCVQTML